MSTLTLTKQTIRRIITFQVLAALVLGLLSLVAAYFMFVKGYKSAYGFNYQFYADFEENIPNWYAANVLLFNALTLGLIAWTRRLHGDRLHWAGLALIFVYLSADEIASIHNKFDPLIHSIVDTHGILHFVWVVPYGIFSAFVGFAYLRFLRDLPRRTAVLMAVSGILYMAAALGMEVIEGPVVERQGHESMAMALLATAEETLELGAMALFSYTLLSLMFEQGAVRLTIEDRTCTTDSEAGRESPAVR